VPPSNSDHNTFYFQTLSYGLTSRTHQRRTNCHRPNSFESKQRQQDFKPIRASSFLCNINELQGQPDTLLQTRNAKLPKGDPDGTWTHDLYESHNSLSARISGAPTPPKPVLNNIAQKALKEATATLKSTESLSIKGASQGNVVEVKGLAPGTTAEDVAAIFKQCGPIVDQKLVEGGNNVRVRIHFKTAQAATSAIAKFNNQPADGKILSVVIVGASTAGHSLASRIGKGGLGLVRQEGSVDVLMDTDPASSS